MTKINLLPWREALRVTQKRQLIQILSMSLIGTIVLSLLLSFCVDYFVARQQQRSVAIKAQVTQLSVQVKNVETIKKQILRLTTWLQLIDKSHTKSIHRAQLFDALARVLSPNLLLVELRCLNNEFTARGFAGSQTEVTTLIHRLSNVNGLYHAKLIEMKVVPESRLYHYSFTITASLL